MSSDTRVGGRPITDLGAITIHDQLCAQGVAVRRVLAVGALGVHGRVRGGRAALVRVAGADQRRAHGEAVQEVPAARAVGRADGAVRARVQAAEGQPETLPGAHQGGGRHATVARRALRRPGGDGVRRAAVDSAPGQVTYTQRRRRFDANRVSCF